MRSPQSSRPSCSARLKALVSINSYDSLDISYLKASLILTVNVHLPDRMPDYLQHYKPPDEKQSEYQTIPLSKIEDFGVHANSYYSLDISYFKSSLDAGLLDQLWGKYWVNTLASSPLLATRDLTAGQMRDIGTTLQDLTSFLKGFAAVRLWRSVISAFLSPFCNMQALCRTDVQCTSIRPLKTFRRFFGVLSSGHACFQPNSYYCVAPTGLSGSWS